MKVNDPGEPLSPFGPGAGPLTFVQFLLELESIYTVQILLGYGSGRLALTIQALTYKTRHLKKCSRRELVVRQCEESVSSSKMWEARNSMINGSLRRLAGIDFGIDAFVCSA